MLKVVDSLIKRMRLGEDSTPNFTKQHPDLAGIINGKKAFDGPEQVVIDLTNRCNERCIACWLYSPLLKEKPQEELLKQEIGFERVKALITCLAAIGTKRIRLTGGGEPFMHPKIMPLIEHIKEKGLICCLTTNFSLLNEEQVRRLIKLEVDELAISLWASNKETYEKLHPGTAAYVFERIKKHLLILRREKKERPLVTICNVICNLNFQEVGQMFQFALDNRADAVYFTLVDVLAGTEGLLLNARQKQEVLRQAAEIQKINQGLADEERIDLDYFAGFLARLQEDDSLRGEYDKQRVEEIPCYVGWIFARILADGSVAPCCRAVHKLMGNINTNNFGDIWFGKKYNEFRTKAKSLSKRDDYFSEIRCLKMCDNLMHNQEVHKRLSLCLSR